MSVSVCMATFNGERFLREQLDSILPQLGAGDELLVADDGSSDLTLEILGSYAPRVRVTDTTPSGGVVANFERVLKLAQGDHVFLCDQDDVWFPGRVERMRALLDEAELVLVNAQVTDAALVPGDTTLFDQLGRREGLLANLWRNSFVGCCLGFRRSLLLRALPFPPDLPWHDWFLGLLAERGGGVVRESAPWGYYRRHDDNASPTGGDSGRSWGARVHDRLRMLRCLRAVGRRAGHRRADR